MKAAPYFPCSLNVRDKKCLVIGNDREAHQKSLRLLESGARVTVVAPEFSGPMKRELRRKKARLVERSFTAKDINGCFFVVFSYTSNKVVTKRISRLCRAKKILLCAIDQPKYCDVVNVSVYDRGLLRMTIGTGGAAPAVSRKIREGLESSLEKMPLEAFMNHLARLRVRLEKTQKDSSLRRKELLKAVEGFVFKAQMKLPRSWKRR